MSTSTQSAMVEESTVSLSSEGLSVHMRIPAERGYLGNAVLTLRGICEHVAVSLDRSNRIILALEEALMNAMEHAYKDVPEEQGGFIDLQFAVEGSELSLIVEDYGCGLPEGAKKPLSTEDEILCDRGRGLNILDEIPDKILVDSARGRGTRTSMLFYLVSCD